MTEIFREENLDTLSDPERLDEYVRVVPVPAWLAISIVLLVIVIFGVWALLGDVNGVSPIEALFG